MFKETYGFDTDVIKSGSAVEIDDSSRDSNTSLISWDREADNNYFRQNMSGVYLVNESSPTLLRLIEINGYMVKIPVKHFIGDNPRMSIKILK